MYSCVAAHCNVNDDVQEGGIGPGVPEGGQGSFKAGTEKDMALSGDDDMPPPPGLAPDQGGLQGPKRLNPGQLALCFCRVC